MPDFSGAALGFMLQIDDQATKTLDSSRKGYLALANSMEKVAKVSNRTAGKASQGMALLAGSIDTVSTYTDKSTTSLEKFVKGINKANRSKPLKVQTEFAAEALTGSKKGKSVTLKAVYPIGDRDPHFNRTNLLQAYKQMPVAPDYVMNMPFMAEGTEKNGVPAMVTKPTVAMIGEAGPEAVVPMEKMSKFAEAATPTGGTPDVEGITQTQASLENLSAIFADVQSKSASWGSVGAKKEADKIIKQIEKINDATLGLEDRWDAVYEAQAVLVGMESKIRKAARGTGQSYRLLSDQLGVTTNMTRVYQASIQEASEDNNGFTSSGLSVITTLDTMKGAFMDAITQSGALSVAVGAAAFAVAYSLDTALFEVRQNMDMTTEQFIEFEQVGRSTMTEFGTTMEETAAILKKAAFNKLTGKDMRDFVKTVAMSTQALEGMGVSADDMSDLVWDGLNKVGIKGEAANRVISGLAKAAKIGNVSFNDLADTLKKNNELFNFITLSGGNAEKAMLGLASVQATLANAWAGMDETTQFINDITDRRKWGEMGTQLGAISRASGLSALELEKMAMAGDTAGLAAARMSVAFEIPEHMMRDPQRLQEMYGMTREEVMQLTSQYGKGQDGLRKFTQSIAENTAIVAADAAKQESLTKGWNEFNNTIGHVWDRISKKVVPILWELGQPIIWIANIALKPLIWGLDMLTTIFDYIPGPIKTVMGLFLGLSMAVAAYNAVMQLNILSSMKTAVVEGVKAAALSVTTVATWAVNAATWAWNAALYANPIGLVVIGIVAAVAAMAALVYGFMEGATWAKYLGVAMLVALGPMGMLIAGAVLLYDTFFGGGDMLTDLFASLTGGMNWLADAMIDGIDWVIGFIETIPDKIIGFLSGIPDMIAGIFSGGGGGGGKVSEALKKMFWAGLRLVVAMFVKLPWELVKLQYKMFMKAGGMLVDAITYPYRMAWNYVSGLFSGGGGILGAMEKFSVDLLRILTYPFTQFVKLIDWVFGTSILSSISSALDGVKGMFSDMWSYISGLFAQAGDLFSSVKEGIWSWIKGLVNVLLIDPINTWIAGLNAALDYVPGLGPKEVGSLPRLADGGIVTGPTTAMIGESGAEAIIPLDDVRAIGEFRKAATGAGTVAGGGGGTTVNVEQKKVEDLLLQIRDLLAVALSPAARTTGAKSTSGMNKLASSWEA